MATGANYSDDTAVGCTGSLEDTPVVGCTGATGPPETVIPYTSALKEGMKDALSGNLHVTNPFLHSERKQSPTPPAPVVEETLTPIEKIRAKNRYIK